MLGDAHIGDKILNHSNEIPLYASRTGVLCAEEENGFAGGMQVVVLALGGSYQDAHALISC